MLKKLFTKSLYYFALLAIGKLLTAVFFVFLARRLQPEKFGLITLFFTVTQIGAVLADFGLKSWYQKTAACKKRPTLLAEMASWRMLFYWLSVIALLIIQICTHWLASPLLPFVLVALLGEALLSIADAYYLSLGDSLRLGWKLIIRNCLLFSGLFFIHTPDDWVAFLWLYDITLLLVAAGYFPISAIKPPQRLTSILSSWPYAIIDDLGVIYGRADQLLVERLLGSDALGIYGAAYRYIDAFNLLPQALFHNLFPLAAQPGAITRRQWYKMVAVMSGLGLVIALGIFTTSHLLTSVLLGSEYAAAGDVLCAFAPVIFLFFLNSPSNTLIQSSDQVRSYVPWLAATTFLNIVFNYWWLPDFGLRGCVWAMLASEGILTVVNWWQMWHFYQKVEAVNDKCAG